MTESIYPQPSSAMESILDIADLLFSHENSLFITTVSTLGIHLILTALKNDLPCQSQPEHESLDTISNSLQTKRLGIELAKTNLSEEGIHASEPIATTSTTDLCAQNVHLTSDLFDSDPTPQLLPCKHRLEIEDPHHRYGTYLRPYYDEWRLRRGSSNESFFEWLDQGDGQHINIKKRTRSRAESVGNSSTAGCNENHNSISQGTLNGNIIKSSINSSPSEINSKISGENNYSSSSSSTSSSNSNSSSDNSIHSDRRTNSMIDSTAGTVNNVEEHSTRDCLAQSNSSNCTSSPDGSLRRIRSRNLVPKDKLDRSTVRYLDEDERLWFQVERRNGDRLIWKNRPGQPQVHTTDDHHRWIFVIDEHLKMYVNLKKKAQFHHSSFVAGGPVRAAGRIEVQEGRIVNITPNSGHYCTSMAALHRAFFDLFGECSLPIGSLLDETAELSS